MNDDLFTALRRIGRGYLFIHFHIHIGTLDILPDWLGYYWILLGIWAIGKEIESTKLLEPFAIAMIAWSGLEWLLKLIGGSLDIPVLSLLVTAITLYLHFQLLTDIGTLADDSGCPEGTAVRKLRTVYTVTHTLSVLKLLFTGSDELNWLLIGLAVLHILVVIVLYFVLRELSDSITDIPAPIDCPDYKQHEAESPPEPDETA